MFNNNDNENNKIKLFLEASLRRKVESITVTPINNDRKELSKVK
jgi:hypothetical protein